MLFRQRNSRLRRLALITPQGGWARYQDMKNGAGTLSRSRPDKPEGFAMCVYWSKPNDSVKRRRKASAAMTSIR